jgi:NADPH:quinone reductase-like Zn-dependent oxidoreductase
VKASRLAAIPPSVSDAHAAALPMAGLTALRTVRMLGSVLGRDVLITGASGGVGRFQVQLAAHGGARVTALTRSADELPGAHAVVTDLAAAGTFDAALESVGGAVLTETFRVLRPGAQVVLLGATGGQPTPISIYDFIGHEGVTIGTYFSYAADDSYDARDLTTLLEMTATRSLIVKISSSWPLAEAHRAIAELNAGGTRGKIVLTNGEGD